jgi:chromosome segregation ATPase
MDVERSYEYFITALNDYVIKEGHGAKSYVGNNIGKSGSFIGQILKKGSSKKASLKTQIAIAEFISGSYESFIQLGQKQIQQRNGSIPTTKRRSIKQTTQEVCKEDAVNMDEDVKIMLQRYDKMIESLEQDKRDLRADLENERQEHKSIVAELREDYREMKADNKELRQGYKQLLEQYRALKQKKAQSSQSPDKSEEKKAVNQ